MWKRINARTINRNVTSSNTINILGDEAIASNDIRNDKNLRFRTIYNLELIDQHLASRNSQYLHQVHRPSFTIEPLKSLIGQDSFVTFSKEILEGNYNFENSMYHLT